MMPGGAALPPTRMTKGDEADMGAALGPPAAAPVDDMPPPKTATGARIKSIIQSARQKQSEAVREFESSIDLPRILEGIAHEETIIKENEGRLQAFEEWLAGPPPERPGFGLEMDEAAALGLAMLLGAPGVEASNVVAGLATQRQERGFANALQAWQAEREGRGLAYQRAMGDTQTARQRMMQLQDQATAGQRSAQELKANVAIEGARTEMGLELDAWKIEMDQAEKANDFERQKELLVFGDELAAKAEFRRSDLQLQMETTLRNLDNVDKVNMAGVNLAMDALSKAESPESVNDILSWLEGRSSQKFDEGFRKAMIEMAGLNRGRRLLGERITQIEAARGMLAAEGQGLENQEQSMRNQMLADGAFYTDEQGKMRWAGTEGTLPNPADGGAPQAAPVGTGEGGQGATPRRRGEEGAGAQAPYQGMAFGHAATMKGPDPMRWVPEAILQARPMPEKARGAYAVLQDEAKRLLALESEIEAARTAPARVMEGVDVSAGDRKKALEDLYKKKAEMARSLQQKRDELLKANPDFAQWERDFEEWTLQQVRGAAAPSSGPVSEQGRERARQTQRTWRQVFLQYTGRKLT
jgi:hypothetical protein